MYNFRAPKDLVARLDAWGVQQDLPLSRSEAIRALIERGLKPEKKR